jgi:glycine cleavage system regulatory protein
MTRKILTLVGPDRPGLVNLLADRVRQRHGNWLTSRMIRLAGQFSGIVEVDLPSGKSDALLDDLDDLKEAGFALLLLDGGAPAPADTGTCWQISLQGNDRPGIVQEVSRAVASAQGNVEEWASQVVSAPMTGAPRFELEGLVRLPADADPESLRQALEDISSDLAVDIQLDKA